MTNNLLSEILGDQYGGLPKILQEAHSFKDELDLHGQAQVRGGQNFLSKLIRVMALLPPPAHRVPITVHFRREKNQELWQRTFGKNKFNSRLVKEGSYLVEHILPLPVCFLYKVSASSRAFSFCLVGVRIFRLPLPRFLWPNVLARTDTWRGRYRFGTRVGFWFCGWVITYCGTFDDPTKAKR